MNKYFVVLVLIILLFGGCYIFSSAAGPSISKDMAEVEMYRIELAATQAAATPDTIDLLNTNREGLYEAEAAGGGSGLLGWVVAFLLMALIFAVLLVVGMHLSTRPLKEVRLLRRTGASRQARRITGGVPQVQTIEPVPYAQITDGQRGQ